MGIAISFVASASRADAALPSFDQQRLYRFRIYPLTAMGKHAAFQRDFADA